MKMWPQLFWRWIFASRRHYWYGWLHDSFDAHNRIERWWLHVYSIHSTNRPMVVGRRLTTCPPNLLYHRIIALVRQLAYSFPMSTSHRRYHRSTSWCRFVLVALSKRQCHPRINNRNCRREREREGDECMSWWTMQHERIPYASTRMQTVRVCLLTG